MWCCAREAPPQRPSHPQGRPLLRPRNPSARRCAPAPLATACAAARREACARLPARRHSSTSHQARRGRRCSCGGQAAPPSPPRTPPAAPAGKLRTVQGKFRSPLLVGSSRRACSAARWLFGPGFESGLISRMSRCMKRIAFGDAQKKDTYYVKGFCKPRFVIINFC